MDLASLHTVRDLYLQILMIMKQITLLTILCLLAACENEIPYNPGGGQPVLVLNALLETGEHSTNCAFLYQSDGINIGKVDDDATLRLYINDVLAETPQEVGKEELIPYNPEEWPSRDQYEEYLTNIGFKKFRLSTPLSPGDRIRIEATACNGTMHAVAETRAPSAPETFRVDTATVRLEDYREPHRRYLIHVTDRPGERNYYRLDIRNDFLVRYQYYVHKTDENGNELKDEEGHYIYTPKDSLARQDYISEIINREDMILTDGHVIHSQDEADNALFPRIENKYNIFSDAYFPDASATLKVYTSCYEDFRAKDPAFPMYVNDLETYCTQTIRVRLLSLEADTYRYIQALNCLEDDDYDTALMEPVSLPCNVQGGIGFVGVMTPREVSFTLPELRCGIDYND